MEMKPKMAVHCIIFRYLVNFRNAHISSSISNLIIKLMKVFMLYFSFLVYLRAVGGEVGATSTLAPKIGPLGLVSLLFEPNVNIKNVIFFMKRS